MKYLLFITLLLSTVLSGISFADPPATLALQDLIKRPDLWPDTITLQQDLQFNSGAVVHKGDKATVLNFDGTRVVLQVGKILFASKPEDCGLLDAANQAWTALTPAQRAIDPTTLAADPSLWPDKVTVIEDITCNYGKLAPGTEVQLISYSSAGVLIVWPNGTGRLSMNLDGTDLIKRARLRVLMDPDKRPSRLAPVLQSIMVDSDGKPYQDPKLDDKKIFAFYFGAGWCQPCRDFSPALVSYATDAMTKYPQLQVVLMDRDPQVDQMLAYMKDEKMLFPAVPMKTVDQTPFISKYEAQIIPELVIVDRFGKVLADNDDHNGNRGDPADTIKQLDKILAAQQVN